ncbi:hypothetical protein IWGMT90018_06250 [Mycobacterium kiyosense]|nr:hypothetical protein IWGMT90018_06250 [Mycobacterium kiyosense]
MREACSSFICPMAPPALFSSQGDVVANVVGVTAFQIGDDLFACRLTVAESDGGLGHAVQVFGIEDGGHRSLLAAPDAPIVVSANTVGVRRWVGWLNR